MGFYDNAVEQGFSNYGSPPQMRSLSEILGSRDFNSLQNRVAVLLDIVVVVCPAFYQKLWKKRIFGLVLEQSKKYSKLYISYFFKSNHKTGNCCHSLESRLI